jgi:hypothetical protein
MTLVRSGLAAVCLAACTLHPVHAETNTAAESRLKAAFVSKFAQFVEWPPGALSGRTTIDICVTPSPSGTIEADLQQLVTGQSLNDPPIAVRRILDDSDLPSCQVLFLPARSSASRHRLLQQAQSRPILTVGDDSRFLDEGGIVRLRSVQGRIRFDVDAAAARRAGLRVSSQLLRLALTVRGASQ